MFKGIITAIITPFREGKIDFESLAKIIDYQADNEIKAIIVGGSTGEGLLLSTEMKLQLFEKAIEFNQGRMKIIASTGTPSTTETLALSQKAEALGADALLIISPWYVKPSQESLFQHFKTVHEGTNLPIIIYNHPGRCGVDITPETVGKLSELPRIVGFKDSSSDLSRVPAIRSIANSRMKLFAGNDDTAPGYLALGGAGIICVASNVVPSAYVQLFHAWEKGDLAAFQKHCDILYPLVCATNLETNPAPIKYAVHLLGLCSTESLLPYVPLKETTRSAIKNALKELGLR